MTIGQRLRAAREAKEMSIGDIARRTYIQPKFIQAIDEDNLALMPSSHLRLFIREYAKVVGVRQEEVDTLLADYEPPPPTPVVDEQAAPQKGSRRSYQDSVPAPPPTIAPLPEGERKAYGEVMRRLSSGRGVKLGGSNTSVWLIGGALVLLLLVGVYYFFFANPGEPHAAGEMPATDTTAGSSPANIISGGTDSTAQQGPQAPADDSLTLEGRATARVWFAIVMDGKRSETGTLDSGAVKVWRAAETFKMSLGNAGGLTLALNEKPIGTLGAMRTSIRNQIIDVNGVRKALPGRRTTSSASTRRQASRSTRPTPRVITPTEMRTSQPPP